jgi:hypothetical protein
MTVYLPVEMTFFKIAQINMIEKWNFLNFKKWGKLQFFRLLLVGDVCF